jgi:hypothetical protein
MKIRYEKPKGRRFKRYFLGIQPIDKYNSEEDTQYWYNYTLGKWQHNNELDRTCSFSNAFWPCRTVRAFRRHLKKHPEMKGKLRLVNRYIGYDAYG